MLRKLKNALTSIKQRKQDTAMLEYLTKLKLEVAKNMTNDNYNEYSILYSRLGQLEHSLYRYNEFVRAGLDAEAEAEGEIFMNLAQSEDGSPILKGGISNTRYVWRTEVGACKVCQELDGKIFDSLDEVPERPHPNCKCEIEQLPDDKKNDEPCDCWKVLENIDEVITEGENLAEEIEVSIAQLQDTANEYSVLNSEYAHSLINDLISLEQPYVTLMHTSY